MGDPEAGLAPRAMRRFFCGTTSSGAQASTDPQMRAAAVIVVRMRGEAPAGARRVFGQR